MWDGLSTALGYASICAWLGAQMPQVYENYKNQSVEGLALPFLTSWMIGDATNLIGCILTHQLPFQTYLATYFVFVDFCLLTQYAYYSSLRPSFAPPSPASIPTPRLGETPRQSYIRAARSETWMSSSAAPGAHHTHGHSHSSGRHRAKRSSKSSSRRQASRARQTTPRSGDDSDPLSASWLSECSSTHSPSSALKGPRAARDSPANSTPTSPVLPEARGRSLHRPLPPPTRRQLVQNGLSGAFGELETISGSPSTGPTFQAPALQVAFDPHEQVLDRHGGAEQVEENGAFEWGRHARANSSNSRSRPPPPARRSNSMVFLSVGLLVSFGRWGAFTGEGPTSTTAWSLEVGSPLDARPQPSTAALWAGAQHPAFFRSQAAARTSATTNGSLRKRETFPLDLPSHPEHSPTAHSPAALDDIPEEGPDDPDSDEPWYPHRNWERFLGRASAWLCTSLYLTSRLPQIWQNFRRRSVEGLAMMLFVMAFVGNSLYVLSIITNPLMRSPGYLLESTPYLLGSGGTLCFDMTIVMQSWLYSPKRLARREFERRRNASKLGLGPEEEEALLREEDDPGDVTPRSRSRMRSAGVPGGSRPSSLRPSRSRTTSRPSSSKSASSSRSRDRPHHAESRELEDRHFDWSSVEVDVNGAGPARDRSASRPAQGRERTVSAPMVGGGESIAEEGESGVTIRG